MFDVSVITSNLPLIWPGLLVTLYYTIETCTVGLAIGLVVGLIQLSPFTLLTWIGRILRRVLP